jgi:alpha-L-arabinofuranosidase
LPIASLAVAVTMMISADRPGIPVSPRLYGAFFEEINHAGDGGIYAELARNGGFRETGGGGRPPGWSGQGTLDGRSLRLDAPAAAVNEGYWGIAVRKGASYRLVVDARASANGSLVASLEDARGRPYARARIEGLSTNSKRFTLALKANGDDAKARLVFSAPARGTVWLGGVSLFPVDTWKGRPNGLRRDLAERVDALHPAFLRFPGGCYIEGGDFLKDAFRWKTTLGDAAGRAGHLNGNWGYRSSDGLGFHEYLQWCEDLGAEPLFVVNCGMSHKESVPLSELEPWVQDALDAVEYANGPATGRWGALRAARGHPAPFKLRYIEIGNESGVENGFSGEADPYTPRYRRFYDALKKAHPEIQTIANARVPHAMEFVDEHYYDGPEWFWANAHRYDGYDRAGPKIVVGEYAVTKKCGRGNLRAALAEAAFMTGLERDSDVVAMASYAPLLANARDRKWSPDAIVFDGGGSYGTPSYYVQKMFAENRADRVLPLALPDFPDLAGVAGSAAGGDVILKVVNGSDSPRRAAIELTGAGPLSRSGRSVTLASGDLDDENSLSRPEKIVPAAGTVEAVAAKFFYTFPARSLTVLRLAAREGRAVD